jgi:hypothetical protein
MRSAIGRLIRRVLQYVSGHRNARYVTGPLVKVSGPLGPEFPVDKNPHDTMFS